MPHTDEADCTFWNSETVVSEINPLFIKELYVEMHCTLVSQSGGVLPVVTRLSPPERQPLPWTPSCCSHLPASALAPGPSVPFLPSSVGPTFQLWITSSQPLPQCPIWDKHLWLTSALSPVHCPGIFTLRSQMLLCQMTLVMPLSRECQS